MVNLFTFSNLSKLSDRRGSHPSTASPATAVSQAGQPAATCSASVSLPNLMLKTDFFSERWCSFLKGFEFLDSSFEFLESTTISRDDDSSSFSFSFSGSSFIFSNVDPTVEAATPPPLDWREMESKFREEALLLLLLREKTGFLLRDFLTLGKW